MILFGIGFLTGMIVGATGLAIYAIKADRRRTY